MVNPKTAAKVGIFSFFVLLLIAFLIVWQSSIFLRASGNNFTGVFEGINGLLEGAPVRYRGFKVGYVAKIIPEIEDIKVEFWVNSDLKIPEGSTLKIAFDGLIGEKYLEIVANTKSRDEFFKTWV